MTPEKFSNPPEKPLKTPEKFNVNLSGHPVQRFKIQDSRFIFSKITDYIHIQKVLNKLQTTHIITTITTHKVHPYPRPTLNSLVIVISFWRGQRPRQTRVSDKKGAYLML